MKPIIFSAESVRAILEGRKTQTRRVVKETTNINGTCNGIYFDEETERWYWQLLDKPNVVDLCLGKCPFGKVGDRLWVRETWALRTPSYPNHHSKVFFKDEQYKTIYHQDTVEPTQKYGYDLSEKSRWRSPILMPRWASRLTLEITDIRVERVQEITHEGVKEEGIYVFARESVNLPGRPQGQFKRFANHWNSLNAKRGYPWEKNPWVWVISFRRVNET